MNNRYVLTTMDETLTQLEQDDITAIIKCGQLPQVYIQNVLIEFEVKYDMDIPKELLTLIRQFTTFMMYDTQLLLNMINCGEPVGDPVLVKIPKHITKIIGVRLYNSPIQKGTIYTYVRDDEQWTHGLYSAYLVNQKLKCERPCLQLLSRTNHCGSQKSIYSSLLFIAFPAGKITMWAVVQD